MLAVIALPKPERFVSNLSMNTKHYWISVLTNDNVFSKHRTAVKLGLALCHSCVKSNLSYKFHVGLTCISECAPPTHHVFTLFEVSRTVVCSPNFVFIAMCKS